MSNRFAFKIVLTTTARATAHTAATVTCNYNNQSTELENNYYSAAVAVA